jgi:aminomethyltransferase
MDVVSLRRSPLHNVHAALGARFTQFGGWEMPLSYAAGTLAEHIACRQGSALFDVSHLGTVRLQGADALQRINDVLSNDITKIDPGETQYSHLCNDDGGVEDDVIIWWRSIDCFDVMPNAANVSRVLQALGGSDVTSERCVIALQGPTSNDVLARVVDTPVQVQPRRIADVSIGGVPCVAAGTGYTGEHGAEIAIPVDDAAVVWSRLVDSGAMPAGLGARDTLRLEAGLPLHGHELSPTITPLEAGFGWAVGWTKPTFRGREALLALRQRGVDRHVFGLLAGGRQPLRDDAVVRSASDEISDGIVTSGGFSPMIERGIGLAMLDSNVSYGDQLVVELRGRSVEVTVVKPPFVSLPSVALTHVAAPPKTDDEESN